MPDNLNSADQLPAGLLADLLLIYKSSSEATGQPESSADQSSLLPYFPVFFAETQPVRLLLAGQQIERPAVADGLGKLFEGLADLK